MRPRRAVFAALALDPQLRMISVSAAAASLHAATARGRNKAFAELQGKANVFVAGDPFATTSVAARAE